MTWDEHISALQNRVDHIVGKYEALCEETAGEIDLALVADIAGVALDYREMVPEGLTWVDREKLTISLQSNFRTVHKRRFRERFTLAHELCHALLYDKLPDGTYRRPRRAQADIERECNRFAGRLLMPESRLRKLIRPPNRVRQASDCLRLANTFAVSLGVCLKRMSQSDVEDLVDDRKCVVLLGPHPGSVDHALVGRSLRHFLSELHWPDFEQIWPARFGSSLLEPGSAPTPRGLLQWTPSGVPRAIDVSLQALPAD